MLVINMSSTTSNFSRFRVQTNYTKLAEYTWGSSCGHVTDCFVGRRTHSAPTDFKVVRCYLLALTIASMETLSTDYEAFLAVWRDGH